VSARSGALRPRPPVGAVGGQWHSGGVTGPDPAVAQVRVAVRRALSAHLPSPAPPSAPPPATVLVACSGGADSVALAAAVAFEAPRLGIAAGAVTVDHGLQPGSAQRAAQVAGLLRDLGLAPVLASTVDATGPGGPEAAARQARYAALSRAAAQIGAGWVLLGHTLDDQAETVLLGLGRGSGPRSIAGMRPADPPYLRPLLGVRRATTVAACAAEGRPVWDDPHNADPRFRRARLRHEVLPLLEDVLGGGVAEALARTATMLRTDLAALDAAAADLAARRLPAGGAAVPVAALADLPDALRHRLLRAWLAGVPDLSSAHLAAVDDLITCWRGQGPVYLPGGLRITRRGGALEQHPA
jgi:tRNA(Ile)-lysidine synthase